MSSTEHIFNIAIAIDEDGIRERAEKFCAEKITKALDDQWIKNSGYFGNKFELGSRLESSVSNAVQAFMEKHKEEIFDIVVTKVAEKIVRSKKYRETIIGEVSE